MVVKNKINEEDELEGKKLATELGKYATRISREAVKDVDAKRQAELATAIGLLNHAQGLVSVNDSLARRLLASVKRLI